MVTRGWLDPQNRNSLTRSDRVEPGERYTMRWDLQPDDHVFAAGHRIGLVVVSDRPRLHDPPEARDAAHAGPERERDQLACRGRRGRSSLTKRVAIVSSR